MPLAFPVLQQPGSLFSLPAPPPLTRARLVLLRSGYLGGRLVDVRVEFGAPERHLLRLDFEEFGFFFFFFFTAVLDREGFLSGRRAGGRHRPACVRRGAEEKQECNRDIEGRAPGEKRKSEKRRGKKRFFSFTVSTTTTTTTTSASLSFFFLSAFRFSNTSLPFLSPPLDNVGLRL